MLSNYLTIINERFCALKFCDMWRSNYYCLTFIRVLAFILLRILRYVHYNVIKYCTNWECRDYFPRIIFSSMQKYIFSVMCLIFHSASTINAQHPAPRRKLVWSVLDCPWLEEMNEVEFCSHQRKTSFLEEVELPQSQHIPPWCASERYFPEWGVTWESSE